jgi:KDO2-lipid IV(A) lauroyltransferase
MYYIVYGFFYLLSLLPWFIIYAISDVLYILVFYIVGYRKKVVFHNLAIAFPEKTEKERLQIAKAFYHQFIDSIIETLKLLSISKKELLKRMIINIEVLNAYYDKLDKVQIMTGHFFSWEFGNLGFSATNFFPTVIVYMPVSNKIFNRIVYNLRTKFGTVLISALDFKNSFHQFQDKKYSLVLVADQNPGNPAKAYWLPFFGKMAPFVKGPEKGARNGKVGIFYANFYKVKRGYYKADLEFIAENADTFKEGELTKLLVNKVEEAVKTRPSNYLWSHRRWKHEFNEEQFGHLVIK